MSNKMKNMRAALLFCLVAVISLSVSAQNVTVTGTVTDKTGETVIGASVVQKGNTSNGSITDIDGNFSLSVPANSTLVFSYVGMTSQEIPLKGKTKVEVVMEDDAQALEEVVVIGYGTVNKRDLTGSVLSACLIYECNSIRNCDRCCIPFRSFVRHRTADPVCADTRIGRRQRCLR